MSYSTYRPQPRRREFLTFIGIVLSGLAHLVQAQPIPSSSPNGPSYHAAEHPRDVQAPDASLTHITFGEFPLETYITSQYSDVGVLFSGSGAGTFITDDGSFEGGTAPTLSGSPLFNGSIIATFVNPLDPTQPAYANNVSFTAGYFNDLESTRVSWLDTNFNVMSTALNESLAFPVFTAPGPIGGFIIEIIGIEPAGYEINNLYFQIASAQIGVTVSRLDSTGLQFAASDDPNTPLQPVTSTTTLATEAGVGHQVNGLVADGVTPLLVHITSSSNNGPVSLQLGVTMDGGTVASDLNTHIRVLTAAGWTQGPDFTLNGTDAYAYITGVDEQDLSFSGNPEAVVTLTVSTPDTASVLASTTFKLRKPPVILVHGYNSDSTAWSSSFLSAFNSYVPSDFITAINYGVTTSIFGQSDDQNTTEALTVLEPKLESALDGAFNAIQANWACTHYDVVGHSQGGLLLRMLCQNAAGGKAAFATRPCVSATDDYRGRFYHVITIGSPHNGTTLLRYWYDRQQAGSFLENLPGIKGLIQPKFDPFGAQIQNANSGAFAPDARIQAQEITATISSGLPPKVGDASPIVFNYTGLCNKAGTGADISATQALGSAGALVFPDGSDGIVNYNSQSCGTAAPLGAGANVAHADVSVPFLGEVFGVASGSSETASPLVAQKVLQLLQGNSWGSFVLPALLSSSTQRAIDEAAQNSLNADKAAQDHAVAMMAAAERVNPSNLHSGTPIPAGGAGQNCYSYSEQSLGPSVVSVIWLPEYFGPNGVQYPTNQVTLQTSGTNHANVSVCVTTGLTGVLLVQPVVQFANGGIVPLAPINVFSNVPGTLTNIVLSPNVISCDVGDVVRIQLIGLYSDGSTAPIYIPSPSEVAFHSSHATVFSVDTNSDGQALSAGAATITATYGTFSAPAAVTVNPVGHVEIIDQPLSVVAGRGGTAAFSVNASGQGTLHYQWHFDGSPLSGKTASSLPFSSLAAANAGSYFVVVSNANSAATSSVVSLTVLAPGQPYLTSQPQNQTIGAGQTASLSVAVSLFNPGSVKSLAAPAYQWFSGSAPVFGATNSTYTTSTSGSYFVRVTNTIGSVTSVVATVSFLTAPQFVVQPAGQLLQCGSGTVLTAPAVGASPLSYYWYVNGTYIPDATGPTLSLNNVELSDSGKSYTVTVGNPYGTIYSQPAIITVEDTLPPVITLNGGATNYVALGTSFTDPGASALDLCAGSLAVTAHGSVNPNISGPYFISYTATDPNGNTGANTRTVIVNPVVILDNPVDTTVKVGSSAYFSVLAQSTNSGLKYQWYSVINGNSAKLTGQTNATLTLTSVTAGMVGGYKVVVTDPIVPASSVTSTVAHLAEGTAPSITKAPGRTTLAPDGAAVTFAVQATGSSPIGFRWLGPEGFAPVGTEFAGVTSNVLTIAPASYGDAGTYSVIVTNAFGTATSAPIVLSVLIDTNAPTITITNPLANARLRNPIMSGIATDNAQVANVNYWLTNMNQGITTSSGHARLGPGSSNRTWTVTARPMPGSNVLAVQSVDFSGNVSPIASRSFFYQVPAALNVTNMGAGSGTIIGAASIKGDTVPARNALLFIGETYTVTAKPDKNSLFVQWQGTLSGTNPVQTFIMQSGAEAYPEFGTNIFLGNPGPFNGLFSSESGVAGYSAGMLQNLAISSAGNFTAKLTVAGTNYPLNGAFTSAGVAYATATRNLSAGGPVTVDMTLYPSATPPYISGSVYGNDHEGWYASLLAYPNTTKTSSAKATMLLPPASSFYDAPPGYGFATLVNHNGMVTLSGSLADGTSFNTTAPETTNGQVPFYTSLYHNGGLLYGWIDLSEGFPAGTVNWIKPAVLSDPRYPYGFSVAVALQGSPYTSPASKVPALSLPSGSLTLSDAFLTAPLVFNVAVSNNNVLAVLPGGPTNFLSGSIDPTTGLLTVTFGTGHGKSTTNGFGAILQNSTSAAGYFLGPTSSGQLLLQNNR